MESVTPLVPILIFIFIIFFEGGEKNFEIDLTRQIKIFPDSPGDFIDVMIVNFELGANLHAGKPRFFQRGYAELFPCKRWILSCNDAKIFGIQTIRFFLNGLPSGITFHALIKRRGGEDFP
jgi:hypothetical protein